MAGKLSAGTLKTWDAITTAVGKEGGAPPNNGVGGAGVLTPDEANARFLEIQQHPAYFNKNHPEHEVYVKKGLDLMTKLHPG
jgi:hypothetical protein